MTNLLRNVIRKFGIDVIRYKGYSPGRFHLLDMAKYVQSDQPVIFDVGANIGQSIASFQTEFPRATVHSFEPSPQTFEKLRQNTKNNNNVKLWNIALGSKVEQKPFLENSNSDMSSFLQIGEFGWGRIQKTTLVPVSTIDQFCFDQNIDYIDICKIDTQGFDFEVIKGAEKTISYNKLGLLYFEIIFSEQYEGLPKVAEIFDFLFSNEFKLITLYPFSYQKGLASWTNGLFIHKSYLPNSLNNE